ncbi:MAG: translation initiation factor IF-3 [Candidatus Wildermuthbacteria bacterium]|nr:translation initiation factor IF-3 [Candidatus Wildermuthbacteria bacterium]
MQKRVLVNNFIRAKEVRLIDETGKQVGIVPIQHALQMAIERDLDLIQVTEHVEPPVCKIGELGKYLYQKEKKDREMHKRGGGGGLKEIRLTFNISTHDLEIRARQAAKFLLEGNRVRIALRLRGRENALQNVAREKFDKLIEMVRGVTPIKIEHELKKEPRGLAMIILKG